MNHKEKLKKLLKKSLKKEIKENKDIQIGRDGAPIGYPAEPRRLGFAPGGNIEKYKDRNPSKGPNHDPNKGVTLEIVDVSPNPSYEQAPPNYPNQPCHKNYQGLPYNPNTGQTSGMVSHITKDQEFLQRTKNI